MIGDGRTVRRFFRRRRGNADLAREIAEHLEQERAENQARGMSAEEASRQAHIKFGSARRVHEDLWRQNSMALFENLLRDLKYAIRTLARTPGFALTAILVMALGIGANTALFTVVKSVLLNPLPYRDPSRLIELYEDESKAGFELHYMPASGGGVAEWQKSVRNRAEIAIVNPWQVYNVSGNGGQLPESVNGAWCSWNLYRVTQRTGELGIRMALGAQRIEVLRLTLVDGLVPVAAGLAAGLAGGAMLVQFLRSMLYGMSPFDWSVFAGAVVVLALTAVIACAVPAWRAAQLDPARALRAE